MSFTIIGDDYDQVTVLDDAFTLPTYDEVVAEAKLQAVKVDALNEIYRLEKLETPRRLAEAVLSDEGKAWLQANRDAIAAERAKL